MTKVDDATEEDVLAMRTPSAAFLPLGSIKPQGWLRDQLRLQAEGLSGRLEEVWAPVGPTNAWRGGRGGDDWEVGPYYVDGLVALAHVLGDDELIERADPWIEAILASQTPTGWFGPCTNDDWWPRIVALKVLTQHAEATGDPRVIPFLHRYFRCQLEELPHRPLAKWARARGADNSLSVWWLYHRTREPWLLSLIDLIDRQTLPWEDALGDRLITGPARDFSHQTHGPNVAMGLKRAGMGWIRDGSQAHRTAAERAFANLDRWHGQAHGWFSGDEWLAGREATAGIETCQVVEAMFSCEVLAAVFGDPVYGDRLESLAFNLLAAACDPAMHAHQYLQQATQIEVSVARRNWTYSSDGATIFGLEPHYGCCTANLHQGWPKFVSSMWMRSSDGGLRAVAYAPAQVRTDIGGEPVELDVDTAYPFEQTIAITVTTERNKPFPLWLRIPGWATGLEVTVDGLAVSCEPEDDYLVLRRVWQGRHVVRVTIPMSVQVHRRERQAAAVSYGPLSMVLPIGEKWTAVEGAPGLGEWEIHRRTSWNVALAGIEDAEAWPVERGPVRRQPFSLGGVDPGEASPLRIIASGVPVRSWTENGADAGPPPQSPVLGDGPVRDLLLVPYGTARLRVAEFPVVGSPTAPEG